ncbi:MAG TPA: MATE family efflux transporter [Chloroflexia bacterium]|nr:MATE family efflux transporter [Chloroflexia bacterium]
MNSNTQKNNEKGNNPASPRRTVWRIAWPTIIEQCLNLTVGLNEVFLIGHLSAQAGAKLGYDSALALAASSLGNFFTWIVLSCFNGIGIATTALVARSFGARQPEQAGTYARQALILALLFGIGMAALMWFTAPYLLYLLGAEGQLNQLGTLFVHTTAFGMPLFAMLVTGNACLRGSGDTRTPLIVMMVVNAVNIAVAWIFVNGQFGIPALGVQGAALGGVTAWTCGALLVMARLIFGLKIGPTVRGFRVRPTYRLDRKIAKEILGLGLPTMGEQWAFQLGNVLFARMLIDQGVVVYAAHNAVINIDSISFLPGMGLGIANTVLVGQSLGAGKPEEAELYASAAYKMGLLFMGIMGLLFIAIPEVFLLALVDNHEVVAAAAPALRFAGLFEMFVGTSFILTGALRGAGDTRYPLYMRMVSSILVRVATAFLFIEILHLGLLGGRMAMAADVVFLSIMIFLRFKNGKWKTIWNTRTLNNATAQDAKVAPVEPLPVIAYSAPDAD